jgi:two-component system, chemotaxis family, protein-glutamate methylesterase/glutaminase
MPRVMICDDSQAYAVALRRALEHDGDISVAAICATAEEAIAALPRVRPDLLMMDLALPWMNGLAAAEQIMSSQPLPILMIAAHLSPGDEKVAAALAAGVLDVIPKQDLDLVDPAGAAAFRKRVRVLSHAVVLRHLRASLGRTAVSRQAGRRTSVIGICGSTGAPYVLARMLGALAADYPIPVLVVQHISPGFVDGLASWLDRSVRVPVTIATDDTRAGPGAWIAPPDAHLRLSAGWRLRLDRRTRAGVHRPSGDVLFKSIAEVAGAAATVIVLSGMGTDGARGTAAVRRGGGLTVVQDQESSAVYGMPQAAIEHGADLVLSPDEIISFLTALRHQAPAGAT